MIHRRKQRKFGPQRKDLYFKKANDISMKMIIGALGGSVSEHPTLDFG